MLKIRLTSKHSLLLGLFQVEVKVEAITECDLVKVLAHLLTPLVLDALLKTWQVAALGKLWHEFVAVLPFVKGPDLLYLPCTLILLDVEKGRSVADLTEPRHLVLLLDLE